MSKGKILIAEDDPHLRKVLASELEGEGYETQGAADGRRALESLAETPVDLILTDLVMPGIDGLELLRRVKNLDTELPVVLMTGFGGVDTAVAALRSGAFDYLTKPLRLDELLVVIERALERSRLRREAAELRGRLRQHLSFDNIVGSSPEMQRVLKAVRHVAGSEAPVTISGESGTGKELVAEAIHQHSKRSDGPFVRVHCATSSQPFLERELFGERGAGGCFERARAGTLFLDEPGELPASTQHKLARLLGELEATGETSAARPQAARVISASSCNLEELVASGQFQEELAHRLNVVSLTLPPLRHRRADIPALVMHFLRRNAAQRGKPVRGIADAALGQLLQHAWPGNVRELETAIERAVEACTGDQLGPQDFPEELVALSRLNSAPSVPGATLEQLERYAILRTVAAVGGSTSRAAAILGVSVRKVQYKLHDYEHAEPGTASQP